MSLRGAVLSSLRAELAGWKVIPQMHGRLIHKQRELQFLPLLVDRSVIVPEDDKSLS